MSCILCPESWPFCTGSLRQFSKVGHSFSLHTQFCSASLNSVSFFCCWNFFDQFWIWFHCHQCSRKSFSCLVKIGIDLFPLFSLVSGKKRQDNCLICLPKNTERNQKWFWWQMVLFCVQKDDQNFLPWPVFCQVHTLLELPFERKICFAQFVSTKWRLLRVPTAKGKDPIWKEGCTVVHLRDKSCLKWQGVTSQKAKAGHWLETTTDHLC